MIVVVIVVLAVLVVAAIIWAHVSAARSENKSVETYERALGVLGEVSKRTESTGFRIIPHDQAGRPHVDKRIEPAARRATENPSEARRGQGPMPPRRLPPAGEPKLRFSSPTRPPVPEQPDGEQSHDLEEADVATSSQVVGAEPAPRFGARPGTPRRRGASAPHHVQLGLRPAPPGDRSAHRHRSRCWRSSRGDRRRGDLFVGQRCWSPRRSAGSTTTTTTAHHAGGSSTTTSTTTTTTVPTTLQPTSTSPLSFTVPSGSYTLAFQIAGGPCWVGIERSTAGPWLYAQTLTAGQSASYKGSGSLIVDLGAPSHFGLTVNGLKAELPTGVTQAYSFDLTQAST